MLNKINLPLFVRYFIGVGVIIVLIYNVQLHNDIRSVLWEFKFLTLLFAWPLIIIHLTLLYYMWRIIILDIGGLRYSEGLIYHSFIGGRTLGFLTPGYMGELLKGLFFQAGLRIEVTSLSMIYAGYGLIINVMLGFIGFIYITYTLPLYHYSIFILLIILILVGIVVLLFNKNKVKKYIRHFMPENVVKLFSIINIQLTTNSLQILFKVFCIGVLANLLAALTFMLILYGFNIYAFTIDGLMAFEAAYLAMYLLPITPSGIGVREGSRLFFFSLIGYKQGVVLCASFIMFSINIIFPAIVGIWSLKYFWQKVKV